MVSRIIAVFFNLMARVIALSAQKKTQHSDGMLETYRISATDLCQRIAKAAGLDDSVVGSVTAIRALSDLEKKRHQLLVLVAAVERIAPALAVMTQEKKWYEKMFGTRSVYKDQRAELDLKKDIEVLLDVLRRIKTGEQKDAP